MYVQFGKILAVIGGCFLLAPISNVVAAQQGYLSPNSITQKALLKPGVKSNKRLKREGYLGSRVIYKTTDPISKLFTKDKELSRACQRGRFLQKKEMQYIAVVDGRKYGAALYQSNMLHDPKKLAGKDKIYLFKGQGTSNCKVFHKQI